MTAVLRMLEALFTPSFKTGKNWTVLVMRDLCVQLGQGWAGRLVVERTAHLRQAWGGVRAPNAQGQEQRPCQSSAVLAIEELAQTHGHKKSPLAEPAGLENPAITYFRA